MTDQPPTATHISNLTNLLDPTRRLADSLAVLTDTFCLCQPPPDVSWWSVTPSGQTPVWLNAWWKKPWPFTTEGLPGHKHDRSVVFPRRLCQVKGTGRSYVPGKYLVQKKNIYMCTSVSLAEPLKGIKVICLCLYGRSWFLPNILRITQQQGTFL